MSRSDENQRRVRLSVQMEFDTLYTTHYMQMYICMWANSAE